MSNVAVQQQGALAPQTEDALILVLQNSLYPGAQPGSVRMVLGYCQASGLDPMQKPVHIVPMWDKNTRAMRDVVMPGISLYRTQAARTGEHVGTDEPVYGPMIDLSVTGGTVRVPEWCSVTVWRMKGNIRCAFVATEYWAENYAVGGKDTTAPNAMWKKRPRGQIAKCAEAQALRKGFPEVGSAPTAEEMEGKSIGAEYDITPAKTAIAAPEASAELLAEAATASVGGVAAYQEFWTKTGKDNRQALGAHHEQFKTEAVRADASRTVEAEPDADFVAGLDAGEVAA